MVDSDILDGYIKGTLITLYFEYIVCFVVHVYTISMVSVLLVHIMYNRIVEMLVYIHMKK